MRLHRLALQLSLLLPLQAVVYAGLAASLSRNNPCTTNDQQLQGLQQGDEPLQRNRSAAAECGCSTRAARTNKSEGADGGNNGFNSSGSSRECNGNREPDSSTRHNCCVTGENGDPSGPFRFSTPWKEYLTGCRGLPSQQVLLLQHMGVNRLAPLLLHFFGFLHSALHLPVLLKRLKGVQHGVSNDDRGRGNDRGCWWSFGFEWETAVPLLRYFLSFLPFLLLLLSSLLLLLVSRNRSSDAVAATTKAAKTVSQTRGSNSDAAYAALLLLLPASCSKESKNGGKRSVMLLLLIIATAAAAATLAVTAADSLKAAGCEAPMAFEAFSGLQQDQEQGSRVPEGLYGLVGGLRQLPRDWDSTALAAIAAARGYAAPDPTLSDAARGAPIALTAASHLEMLLQEGAAAAKQLRKNWLGAQYVLLLQKETKAPLEQQQQVLPQGQTLWRRSKRLLSSLLPLCRVDKWTGSTDSSGSSGRSNKLSLEAGNKDHIYFRPVSFHGENSLDTAHFQKEKQQWSFPPCEQQQGLLRCMKAEELAAAASVVGDALDCALKQHFLVRQFVDSALEPHQLVQQKKELLQVQQNVEDTLQHGLPQLWTFVRLLLQASSRSVEELLRQTPLLLLAAVIVGGAAAGASLVRHLAAEQPVDPAVGNALWQQTQHLKREGALEGMLLRSMEQHQYSREGQQQQHNVALLPIPKTKELEHVVESLSRSSSCSKALRESISMLQLQLEGHAISGCWGPLPDGCVNPEPFQKRRASAAASAAATVATAAARAALRAIRRQVSRLLPSQRRQQQQRRLFQQRPAPCYFVSQDIEDKHLLSRFGPTTSTKSTARLLSIFSLARRVDAARAFIEKRSKADMLLLQQTAAGVEAMELSMQRSMVVAELLRPLAHRQRQVEQIPVEQRCMVRLLALVFSAQGNVVERYETLLLLGALRECEAWRVQQLQQDLSASLL
ncbi:hypothetical protein EBH_0013070 [Eimeria brunetti]|uniref:Transmembrane protein n=1 Tax=Eimeria brunetti TaxID=51314 RepID=U6L8A5_9EIME|nr:hypothetical protein EBH_0013070 [Eimeria brunetti]